MSTRVNAGQISDYDDSFDASWTGLLNGDTGAAYAASGKYSASAWMVTGTFGVGGTVQVQGSNDNVNFFQLKDRYGSAISITAAAP